MFLKLKLIPQKITHNQIQYVKKQTCLHFNCNFITCLTLFFLLHLSIPSPAQDSLWRAPKYLPKLPPKETLYDSAILFIQTLDSSFEKSIVMLKDSFTKFGFIIHSDSTAPSMYRCITHYKRLDNLMNLSEYIWVIGTMRAIIRNNGDHYETQISLLPWWARTRMDSTWNNEISLPLKEEIDKYIIQFQKSK